MMKPSTKRIVIKGTVLSLALNGFVIYSQYHEHGEIASAVWIKIVLFFAASMLFVVGAGVLLGSLEKRPEEQRRGRRK
jgi:hypothetical protein